MPDLTTLLSKFLNELYSGVFGTVSTINTIVLGGNSTSGVRLDLESGDLAVREGDDSAYGNIKALSGTFTNSLIVGSSSAHFFQLGAGGVFRSPATGVVTLLNGAETDFSRLQFGGTTSSFPALKRSSTEIQVRLADDSGYAPLTASSVVTTSSLRTTSASDALGYATGAGGTVTQAANKSTGVTINKTVGQITMNNAALAANTSVTFIVTNSAVAATDVIIANIKEGEVTPGSYDVIVNTISSGSFRLTVRNITAGSLSEAVVISFAVIKGATS